MSTGPNGKGAQAALFIIIWSEKNIQCISGTQSTPLHQGMNITYGKSTQRGQYNKDTVIKQERMTIYERCSDKCLIAGFLKHSLPSY